MKKGILVFVLILFSLTTFFFIKSAFERQALEKRRFQLVCETLAPGMSVSQARSILDRIGAFTSSDSTFEGGWYNLSIHFSDPKIDRKYGSFNLSFYNDKYYRASLAHCSDNPEIFCDFWKKINEE